MDRDSINSHHLATALRNIAEKLESAEPFKLPRNASSGLRFYFLDKANFLAAAKVFGGDKGGDNLFFELKSYPFGLPVELSISRNLVCRRVTKTVTKTEDVWECDPLFTPEEERSIA